VSPVFFPYIFLFFFFFFYFLFFFFFFFFLFFFFFFYFLFFFFFFFLLLLSSSSFFFFYFFFFFFFFLVFYVFGVTTHAPGLHCSAVCLGTALKAGTPRVRFPMASLEFSVDINLPAALWRWSRLSF